jgi:general secretion pathway protein F
VAAFEYKALNAQGKEQKGVLEADSIRQVRQLLRDKGLTPLGVNPTRKKESADRFGFLSELLKPTLSVSERALVTRQLATLIGAGLPIEEALLAVSKQSEKPSIQSRC